MERITIDKRLIERLKNSDIKHNADEIVGICELSDGKIVFLETGNNHAGLEHILTKHRDDFARRGIAEAEIPDAVISAVEQNNIVGYQRNRPIYQITFNQQEQHIAVTVGKNGFIVGANPATV